MNGDYRHTADCLQGLQAHRRRSPGITGTPQTVFRDYRHNADGLQGLQAHSRRSPGITGTQ